MASLVPSDNNVEKAERGRKGKREFREFKEFREFSVSLVPSEINKNIQGSKT